ncbi:MAG: hypothetical protein VW339_05740 [Quisquiliibacterium sp.]
MTQSSKPALLREILASGQFVIAPGVYEMLSAKIADRLGFHALYMTGYGIAASHLGQMPGWQASPTCVRGRAPSRRASPGP